MPFSSFTFRLDLQISDDASLYVVTEGWRGWEWADFKKYGSHYPHASAHLSQSPNSILPYLSSTQFSKCQFHISQAKLSSTTTMSTNHWQRCWYFRYALSHFHTALRSSFQLHIRIHFAYDTIISTHIHTNNISASLFCPGEFFTFVLCRTCLLNVDESE